MSDIVDQSTRSRMMSRIRGRDTKIEVAVRKALWREGFRYRLPRKAGYQGLPGIPDIVLPRYSAVVLTHSCFFHGHDCPLFRMPKQNRMKWEEKIQGNRERDARFATERRQLGWKTLTIWECSMRGKSSLDFDELVIRVTSWIVEEQGDAEISGNW